MKHLAIVCLIFLAQCASSSAFVGILTELPYLLGSLNASSGPGTGDFAQNFFAGIPTGLEILVNPSAAGPVEQNVQFYCGNRAQPNYTQVFVGQSGGFVFNTSIPTYVVIHGYTDSINYTQGLLQLGYAALMNYTDSNICLVNWGVWSNYFYPVLVLDIVPKVGAYLGQFLQQIISQDGVDPATLNLVCHSLGAHACGIAARNLSVIIAVIYGLDPAGPGYTLPLLPVAAAQRLRPTDAAYVQTIMTTPGTAGSLIPLGIENFYANLGLTLQPGCLVFDPLCGHYEAVYYWVASVAPEPKFVGVKCPNQLLAILDGPIPTCDPNDIDYVGLQALRKPGDFFFQTANTYPPTPRQPGSEVLPIDLSSFFYLLASTLAAFPGAAPLVALLTQLGNILQSAAPITNAVSGLLTGVTEIENGLINAL